MFVGVDKLSKEAREAVEEFTDGLNVKMQILREGNDHQWGVKLQYVDDDGKTISEETYMTVRGHSSYVAQFVVFYQDDGEHVDFSDWSPMPIMIDDEDNKLKTLSDFVLVVLSQLTPHPLTAEIAGIEDACGDEDAEEDVGVEKEGGFEGEDE